MSKNQKSLCKINIPTPDVVARCDLTSEPAQIDVDASCITVVEPLFLLRNANAEMLRRSLADVQENIATVNRMPAVNLINAVVELGRMSADVLKSERTISLDVNDDVRCLHCIDFKWRELG